ncbi:Aromatic di-alanine and TPR containing protein [Ceratobasidium theobromae]|uniref:Aromatic di-alanine and TPR containing protein n=1 Tax=Ceratobasidium theobromae TaxID=1582974 RepID=A0A5N5Q8I1_9AGAM|nr:Aromatic di-alanine and TPR containing protein [Ceratobasidium theobromae]
MIGFVEQLLRFASHIPTFHLNVQLLVDFAATCEAQLDRWGILEDVDIAIHYISEIVTNTSNGDHDKLQLALSSLYRERAIYFGALDDLKSATEHGPKPQALNDTKHTSWPSKAIHAGRTYLAHGILLKDTVKAQGYLNKATDLFEKVIAIGSGNIALLVYVCESLAWMCELGHDAGAEPRLRRHLGSYLLTDILDQQNNPRVSTGKHIGRIGFCYLCLFKKGSNQKDLENSIKYYNIVMNSKAIDKRHPCRCALLIGLGHAYLYKKQDKWAAHCFKTATLLEFAIPALRMDACFSWAKVPNIDLVEVYSNALKIAPQLAGLEYALSHRVDNAKLLKNLVQEATKAAIAGNDISLALMWAEQGRGIIVAQMLQLRIMFTHPGIPIIQHKEPELADSLRRATTSLHQLDALMGTMDVKSTRKLHRDGVRWNHLVRKIRASEKAQLGDFLCLSIEKILQLGRKRIIVIINAHGDGWDALMIRKGDNRPQHISLPTSNERFSSLRKDLFNAGLRERRSGDGASGTTGSDNTSKVKGRAVKKIGAQPPPPPTPDSILKIILVQLWNEVVHPILQELGISVSTILP